MLGVSVERVRQLVVAGDLPAQRFGNAWAVSRDALIARRDVPASGGRPLGSVRAWMEIAAGDVDLGRPSRYQRRARMVRCDMSNADVDSLPKRVNAMVSGVRAAVNYGGSLVEDGSIDLYLARNAFDRLADAVAYVVDPLGRLRLRVVDDEAWKIVPYGRFAPMAAVAGSISSSRRSPRHRIGAAGLIDVH